MVLVLPVLVLILPAGTLIPTLVLPVLILVLVLVLILFSSGGGVHLVFLVSGALDGVSTSNSVKGCARDLLQELLAHVGGSTELDGIPEKSHVVRLVVGRLCKLVTWYKFDRSSV